MKRTLARLSIELFNFSNPDDWPRWKKHFKQSSEASSLSMENQTRQVSTLLHCLGEDANDVLVSTNIMEGEQKASKQSSKIQQSFSSPPKLNPRAYKV